MREFLIRKLIEPSSHTAYDVYEVTEWVGGKAPLQVLEVALGARGIMCECDPNYANSSCDRNHRCEHTAVAKTFKRQGDPLMRLYELGEDDAIAYWKGGKRVLLSTIARVHHLPKV